MSVLRAVVAASNSSTLHYQPFCHDVEGWGPISARRYDLTPCFQSVPRSAVALFGLIPGGLALWWLRTQKSRHPTPKDWHYYTNLILVAGIALTSTIEGFIELTSHKNWFSDFRFWATSLQIASLAIAFLIHEYEHERLRVPSGVVLLYWLFYILVSIQKTRSLYIRKFTQHETTFALVATGLILSIIHFSLLLAVPKKQSVYRPIGEDKECPSEYANIFSQMTFGWLTPMLRRGHKTYLTEEDLFDLPPRQTSEANYAKFAHQWENQARKRNPSIWKAILLTYGPRYLCFVPLKIGADSFSYLQPQLLRMLIDFVQSYRTANPDPAIRGFVIAGAMFMASVCQSVGNNNFLNHVFEASLIARAALIGKIYKKSLRLANAATQGTGDIVNLMTTDTQRIAEVARQGHQLWSAPFQIVLCMVSLYQLLGWVGLTGVAVMAIMVPLNACVARLMKRLQKIQMRHKDERTRITTEILNNMKSIKLYSWTAAFSDRLDNVRNNKELKTLRKIGATQAASRFFFNTTPFLVSCSTFLLYVLTKDRPLSINLVFPALTLFNLLTQPLVQMPNVISALIESMVAADRLKKFFLSKEVQSDAVQWLPPAKKLGEKAVIIRDGCFTWNVMGDGSSRRPKKVLSHIDYTACKGQLSCIVGRVGSGKSSLLQAILGDLHKLRGDVSVAGSVAYVAQNAWIMNASVKDNVLFGHQYDPEFYDKTIKACALIEDLAVLPDGDQTQVGEKGIALSGGQKARLQLARAVYARADVYLLDDILSAVDQHVGRHIINNVVGPKGLLRSKTRVLATNSIPVLKEADHIVLLSQGRITERGSYFDAVTKDGEINALIKTVRNNSDEIDSPSTSASASASASPTKSIGGMDLSDDSDESILEGFDEEKGLFEIEPRASLSSLRRASISSFRERKKGDEEMAMVSVTRQTKEISQKGKVKWSVYLAYAHACNFKAICVWIFTAVAVQALQVSSSVWLKNWGEGNEEHGSNASIGKNVGVYFALGMAASAMIVIQTMIMWLLCSIQASKKLHAQMARAMFRSPMSFFETTPMGRILNRFSSDMFRVDEALGRTFSDLFTNLAKTFFTLGVVCTASPVFIGLLIPLGALYMYIQRFYLRTNRELKRLESISRSPIYAHFQESLAGLATIRAFKQQKRWAWQSENRVDNNLKAFFPAIYANRWLGIRLEFIGALVVFIAATLAIIAVLNGGGPSAGMVGLAMSYALQITQSLNMIVRSSVEVDTNIVSVERVLEYAQLPSEAEEVIHGNRPAPTWPSKGAIQFNDYSMRYRPGLELVLKGISMSLKSQEKIGVVGRTGAGKSSLTLSLFRIVEASSGGIEIDNIDTSSIGLTDLRSKLAIIPQDAALFEGTIRDNLDPNHSKQDEELWTALEHARLKEHVKSMPGGLDAAVLEAGSNLSQGQRQLVSLARALLTKSSILVLDEATAAVDVETDALLQETLRSNLFSDRTIITIAHRINTIIDCDRIVVLQRGQIVEMGPPKELIDSRGQFFELAREAGLVDGNGTRA